jgi:ankyrin repeat protein
MPTACKALKPLFLDNHFSYLPCRFQWVYCQVARLCVCLPGRIRQALAELPETLDQTYERTLREIKKVNWDFAHRLLQCVAVAVRPLLVEELADFLAFDFEARPIPRFHEDWRLEDPIEAVMSTCPSLLVISDATNEDGRLPGYRWGSSSKVIQFSHYSVKEYLTSARLADASDNISRRFHIPITSAHILAARGCLSILLHLDPNVTKDSLKTFPLAEYAAQNWFAHARVEGVSQNVSDSMKLLFDPGKPHLAIWVWIHDPVDRQRSLLRGEAPSPMKRTALHYASLCGLLTIVKFLVAEHSQWVNARDPSRGLTSLHLASREGHMEIARFLVESGADARAQDSNWTTPLHLASGRGHLEVARFLIERDADARALDNYWVTPLHLASRNGHLEVVRFLVESGADAKAEDDDGRTPLSLAYSWEVASFFIEHGVDVTAQDNHGSTPLHLASEMGRMEVVRILVDRCANATAKDNDGSTPLHLASYWEKMEIVRFILDHGADVTARDKEGLTPLHHAFGSRYVYMVQFLPKTSPITCRIINLKPITSLSWERVDIIRCLVERGADAAAQDNNGLTPLHLASSWGHMELACLLVEHGADVTAQSKHGLTPLHLALKHEYVEVARFLVEHGADATARHNNGLTPLHLTSFLGDTELVQLILSHGADVTARDKEGLTPLHLALGLEPE